MKILYLCSEPPFPPSNGVRIPAWNFLKILRHRHDVQVLCFSNESKEQEETCRAALLDLGIDSCYVKPPVISKVKKILRLIFSRKPYFVHNPLSKQFSDKMNALISKFKPDSVHFDSILLAEYERVVPSGIAKIIAPNDSMALAISNELQWKIHDSFVKNMQSHILLKSLVRYESKMYQRFSRCCVVSCIDKNYLSNLNSKIKLEVIPNGTELNDIAAHSIKESNKSTLFIGSLTGGNGIYIKKFIKEVWQYVVVEHPDAIMHLVGKHVPKDIELLIKHFPSIQHLGYVHDLTDVYSKNLTVVSPVLKNCGILNKVLDAMAMQKIVIGYKIGFSGIPDCISGKHALMVETAEEMIQAYNDVFTNPMVAVEIGRNARKLVETKYLWQSRTDAINRLYSSN